jgi:hypothetical protein
VLDTTGRAKSRLRGRGSFFVPGPPLKPKAEKTTVKEIKAMDKSLSVVFMCQGLIDYLNAM